jgi:3-polyprenyl-4-hydroxybenzoate decarboxylase
VGSHLKTVVVVDDDIDPFDLGQVWWAINTRVQGSRDIEVLRFSNEPRSDPSIPRSNAEFSDKMIIDATKKLDYPFVPIYGAHWAPVCMPEPEVMDLVHLRWQGVMEGKPQPEKEKELQTLLRGDFEKYWQAFRAAHYTLTEEEEKAEIGRSFPLTETVSYKRKP